MDDELEWLEKDVMDSKIEFQKARIAYHKVKKAYNLAKIEYNTAKEKRKAYFAEKRNLRLERKLSSLGITKIPLGDGRAHYVRGDKEDLH